MVPSQRFGNIFIIAHDASPALKIAMFGFVPHTHIRINGPCLYENLTINFIHFYWHNTPLNPLRIMNHVMELGC